MQALSSIFQPRDSVYATLDNYDSGETTHELTSPPTHGHALGGGGGDDDPFAPNPISPGILPLHHQRTTTSTDKGSGLRPTSLSPPRPRQQPILSTSTTNSPFQAEPIDSHSLSPSHSRSPLSKRVGGGGGTERSMFGSSMGIGNRSLMGLLGGTRYDAGFEEGGLRVGAGDTVLEEEVDENNIDSSQLPPPPSALSSSTSSTSSVRSSSPPPDFTSQTHPTSRSTSHPQPIRLSSSSSSPRHPTSPGYFRLGSRPTMGMSAKDRALWRWVNVDDLDGFLQEVYTYYVGKGIWAIGLERALNLLTVGWVIGFSTFLIGCIDYSILWESHHLREVVVPQCVSRFHGLTFVLFLSFGSFYAWRVVSFGLGVKKLWMMHEFYGELLGVPENDIQTIPWHSIVTLISELRSTHPSGSLSSSSRGAHHTTTSNLDAHDVANRIMREENYLIALFNKDLVDISIPLPAFLNRAGMSTSAGGGDGWARALGKGMLTRTLEWNLGFCLTGFLFGRDGQVRRAFVSERNRAELVEALKRRFILMALINAVLAPFIVLYLCMWSFFRYFEEYHKNPSSIGSRGFTQLARWKFREFNELPHLFQQRLNRAHPISTRYINQFPKEKTALVSNFIAFLAGSFAAVLILFSLIDPDAFLHFEITKGRTVLFYLGVTGTVLAVARGMVPDENKVVDPEELMRDIVEYTHYLPVEWRGKMHSAEVHAEFGQLFQMKVSLFLQELLSVIITPFVLWLTLPNCAGQIVDFFREFTVHVDDLGYVCSFAVFDFKRHGDTRFGAPIEGDNERWKSKEGKMEKSFLGFATQNPAWVPRDQTQSLFLSKMTDASAAPHHAGPSNLHSSQANLHPRFSPNHQPQRSSSRSNRFGPSRFGGNTVAEEHVSDNGRPIDPDKARMYDRAFQRSVMASTTMGTAGGGARNRQRRQTDPIDEESGLDGDSYIATTHARPFGDSIEEDGGLFRDGEEGAASGEQGITKLLGEMYDTTRRW